MIRVYIEFKKDFKSNATSYSVLHTKNGISYKEWKTENKRLLSSKENKDMDISNFQKTDIYRGKSYILYNEIYWEIEDNFHFQQEDMVDLRIVHICG